jgi:chorismate lyase/3-hydroxybenzoate synthase
LQTPTVFPADACGPPEVPRWVRALVAGGDAAYREEAAGLATRLLTGVGFALSSARVRGAFDLGEGAFRERAAAAYEGIRHRLSPLAARQVVRMWNFIPRILSPLGELPHRYMAFNAARHDALAQWSGASPPGPGALIAASGVGHGGADLVIHALAAIEPGHPVENPRQIPAYRYSRRWGPAPPCFARATLVAAAPGRPWLLVSGTASVRGEDSVHAGDFTAQAAETLANLRSLLAAAGRAAGRPVGGGTGCLCRFRHLRAYYVEAARREQVAALLRRAFRGTLSVELVRAELCRPELLLEIEGMADFGD